MARITPFSYQARTSPIHALPPALKLLAYLTLSAAPFVYGPLALVPGVVLVLSGAIAAGIKPAGLLAGSGPLVWTVSCAVLLRTVRFIPLAYDPAGLAEGLRYAGAVLVAFAGGALFFAVTTTGQVRDSLARVEKAIQEPLRLLVRGRRAGWASAWAKRLDAPGISLSIALMLSFLPRIFEIWESAEEAYRARLGKKGLRKFVLLLPLATERLVESAVETALALESRGHAERAANRRASSSACAREE